MDCEDCRHLTVVGLHDTGPWLTSPSTDPLAPGAWKGGHWSTNFEVTGMTRPAGGRNSSVGSAWARCPRCRGFDPPLGTFSDRGDFSLGVNMGSNSISPPPPPPQRKKLSDESINRGLVCAHMHFIARTPKILTFMS